MGIILATFPAEAQARQVVTLGEDRYQVRMTWRERCRAWYFDLYEQGGTAILLGRRVSPGWDLLQGLQADSLPPGFLFVRGADPYERDMLGEAVELVYYGADEVPEPSDPAGISITFTAGP